ncbi:MAG: hypothetical protein E4G97_06205 [Deltaproteobacteria bacterium]|nr:MAG: hypothetical protein E4G97_06205 [Deltaproteobacteria bacterium]
MMKWISGVLAIAALIGLIWKLDGYVAHADDLRLVEMRLEQKIQTDRMKAVQQRNWELEREYRGGAMPSSVEREIQENKHEIEEIKMNVKKPSGGT